MDKGRLFAILGGGLVALVAVFLALDSYIDMKIADARMKTVLSSAVLSDDENQENTEINVLQIASDIAGLQSDIAALAERVEQNERDQRAALDADRELTDARLDQARAHADQLDADLRSEINR